jgi:aminoglycoside/choline kinase family phosphotransferase
MNVTDAQDVKRDASGRAYFRLTRRDGSQCILVQYPPQQVCKLEEDLRVAEWLRSVGVVTPTVSEVSFEHGWAVLQDFGDRDAAAVIKTSSSTERGELVMRLLVPLRRLARVSPESAKLDGLVLDENRMRWELAGFELWFVRYACAKRPVPEVSTWLDDLARRVARHPFRVCHRDYHLNNLFFLSGNEVGVIDVQDALLGPDTYDVVSLLEERDMPSLVDEEERRTCLDYWASSTAALPGWRERFLEARLQRGFKVIGTFSRLGYCQLEGYERWLRQLVRDILFDLQKTDAPTELGRTLLDWLPLGGHDAG